MKTQFSKINIFIILAAISLLGVFVLPNTTKAWSIDWHYPASYNRPSVDITSNTQHVSPGGSVTLSWTSQNVYACAKTGDWYGNASTSGSETVALSRNSKYEITCNNNGGGTSYDSVLVYTDRSSSYPSYTGPSYGNSSNSGNTYSAGSSSNTGVYNPNLILDIKSRDAISSSSFAKEISSQPGRVIDFRVNINNNSVNKIGSMFITLPSRLSYVSGSAYLDGVKLNISSISSIDLSYLSASSQHNLIFQTSVAPFNSFSENTTVLGVNASVKSSTGSAYIASDYTNVLVYKNGNGSEGVVLGASTVNTGTGTLGTVLISALAGFLVILSYLLVKFYKSTKKGSGNDAGFSFTTFISDHVLSFAQKINGLTNKTVLKALEIYDL